MRKRLFALTCFYVMCIAVLCSCETPAGDSEGLAAEMTWQEQYDLGVRYLSEGNYEEAIIAFTAAIEIDPKQPDAYDQLTNVYLAMSDPEMAEQVLIDGISATGSTKLQARLDEIKLDDQDSNPELEINAEPERIPGQWDTYVPSQNLEIPLDVTIISSEGVQPTMKELSYRMNEAYGGIDANEILTLAFGSLWVEFDTWSDGGEYMLAFDVSSINTWKVDLKDFTPSSYFDSWMYQSMLDRGEITGYEELFITSVSSEYSVGISSSKMTKSDMWCLILAAYDESGIRTGYVVYQINNTEDIREKCIVRVNKITGEVIS